MTSAEILESTEKQLNEAVRNCVQQLKQTQETRKPKQEIIYGFNRETQKIVAAAEELFHQEKPSQNIQSNMDKVNQKLLQAIDEVEIHARAGF